MLTKVGGRGELLTQAPESLGRVYFPILRSQEGGRAEHEGIVQEAKWRMSVNLRGGVTETAALSGVEKRDIEMPASFRTCFYFFSLGDKYPF